MNETKKIFGLILTSCAALTIAGLTMVAGLVRAINDQEIVFDTGDLLHPASGGPR